MFKELSNANYERSSDIVSHMPEIEIDKDKRLIAPFEEITKDDEEDEYIPEYILDLNEDLEKELEDIEKEMKIIK